MAEEYEAVMKDFEPVRARYHELFAKLVELKVPGVIDPDASTCTQGDVCHGGSDFHRPLPLDESMPEVSIAEAEHEAILKEFEPVRVRYHELFAKLMEMKVPGVIDPQATSCPTGDVCHGGGEWMSVEQLPERLE